MRVKAAGCQMCIRDRMNTSMVRLIRSAKVLASHGKNNSACKNGYRPVSYTHLDVYKRQVLAIVALQLGWHAAQFGVEKQVQEKRIDQIIAVMAQRNLGETIGLGIGIQRAAAQP